MFLLLAWSLGYPTVPGELLYVGCEDGCLKDPSGPLRNLLEKMEWGYWEKLKEKWEAPILIPPSHYSDTKKKAVDRKSD